MRISKSLLIISLIFFSLNDEWKVRCWLATMQKLARICGTLLGSGPAVSLVQFYLRPLPITANGSLPSGHCIPAKIEDNSTHRTIKKNLYHILILSLISLKPDSNTRSRELDTKITCQSGFSHCNCFIMLKSYLVVLWEEHVEVLNRALQHRVSLSL